MKTNFLYDLIEFSKTVRVLYIEPDQNVHEDTFDIFFDKIDRVSTSEIALTHFYENKYDLIITHINMPKMSGIELLKRIRNISKDITVLIISSETKYFVELIKLGIDGYLLKPLEIHQYTSVIQKVIEKLKNKQELYEYKINLEKKVEEEIFKRTTSEKMLLQQSKLAVMGEMMDAVAHQWRQPINNINMNVDMLQYDFEDDLITKHYIEEFSQKISTQILHMNSTLNEFRSFFRPDKKIEPFRIEKATQSVLLLLKDELIKNTIKVTVQIDTNFRIEAIENEFKHVLINLINNSKDAFSEHDIKDKLITICTKSENDKNLITISDNAGGIPLNVIDNVFEANITTKSEGKGTGIGLYMSKQIVEKYSGTIDVKNIENPKGSLFTIVFPKTTIN